MKTKISAIILCILIVGCSKETSMKTSLYELRHQLPSSNKNNCLYLSINVLIRMPDSSQNKLKFTQKTDRLISDATSFKITFSKPKHQNKEVINCYLRSVMIKN